MLNKIYKQLTEAATQMANGDPNLMLQLVSLIERQAFSDGYNNAIEVLQDTLKEALEKEEKYYAGLGNN